MLQNSLFDLKIMKLFLINTMENLESSKIGWTFLGFFYNFLEIFKVEQKKKKEKFEQYWAQFGRSGPSPGEKHAHPRPCRLCTKAPVVLNILNQVHRTVVISH
jgi:hypothetical protein